MAVVAVLVKARNSASGTRLGPLDLPLALPPLSPLEEEGVEGVVAPACSCLICSSCELGCLASGISGSRFGLTGTWTGGWYTSNSGLLPEVPELSHGKPETGGVVRVKLLLFGAHFEDLSTELLVGQEDEVDTWCLPPAFLEFH